MPTPTPNSNGGSKNGLSPVLADVLIGLRPFVVVVVSRCKCYGARPFFCFVLLCLFVCLFVCIVLLS